ncbi:hypothetical protein D3C73_1368110 [compost metagenome]
MVDSTVSALSRRVRKVVARSLISTAWSSTSRRYFCSSSSTAYFSDPRSSASSIPASGCVARWKSMTSRLRS